MFDGCLLKMPFPAQGSPFYCCNVWFSSRIILLLSVTGPRTELTQRGCGEGDDAEPCRHHFPFSEGVRNTRAEIKNEIKRGSVDGSCGFISSRG